MCIRSILPTCIAMVVGIIATPATFAETETTIVANQSCRTRMSQPDENISDSSKLVVRTEQGDATRSYKSWAKFDISELEVNSLKTATLTVTLQKQRGGSCNFDISYVNDDCLDNIDWDEKSLTWNNAPGNNTTEEGALIADKATHLATVEFAEGVPGDAFTVDVLEALESDTDGIVQFVFHNSSAYMILCTHDHAEEAWRPFLTVTTGSRGNAKKPSPANDVTDVPYDAILTWTPGAYAPVVNGHDVYFSDSFDDVNDGITLVSPRQDANAYDPGRLEFGSTYFWRIDEVNAPPHSTVFRGEIWSFTVEPYARPIPVEAISATASSYAVDQGPEKTIDRSGLDADDLHSTEVTDMWLSEVSEPNEAWVQYEFDKPYKLHQMLTWNYNGQGLNTFSGGKDVTLQYSLDGTDWTQLDGVSEFAKAPGTPGYAPKTTADFDGVTVQYVRLGIVSNWSGGFVNQYGLSEVQFLHIPVSAREPKPESGATDVAVDSTLSWRAGREAAEHMVYLSTDEQAVTGGTAPVETVGQPEYSPALDLNTTYYWRVDEVNDVMVPSVWPGSTWSFTTAAMIIVDDFESYSDTSPNRVFQTWLDGVGYTADEYFPQGYNGNGTGAAVGHDIWSGGFETIMEKVIVHSGSQSMPLYHNGAGSQTDLMLNGEDWTRSGITTLVVHFYGTAGNTGQLYVKIGNTKIPYPGNAPDIATEAWTAWEIDLASSGASVTSVSQLSIGIDGSNASGLLYVDDVLLK